MSSSGVFIMGVVIVISALGILVLMFKIIEFLHTVRRESTKAHYKLFMALLISFLVLMTIVVGDYTESRMSTEARDIAILAFLLLLCVFISMYHFCTAFNVRVEGRESFLKSRPRRYLVGKSWRYPIVTSHVDEDLDLDVLDPNLDLDDPDDRIHVHVDENGDEDENEKEKDLPDYEDLYPPPPCYQSINNNDNVDAGKNSV